MFLVVSWNTKTDKGILTGKFYEALMHKKPIIAIISGQEPDSELKHLIDAYKLGICYEEAAQDESLHKLVQYIQKQTILKISGLPLEYSPDQTAYNIFEYSRIIGNLEKILQQLVDKNTP